MEIKNTLWLAAFLCCFVLSTSKTGKTSQQKSKSVTTLIEAKWPATPYLLETCEYFAEESPDLLWTFIDNVNEIDQEIASKFSEKDWYDEMLERLGTVASPAQISMLKLALSMRIYSPRIEMYAQMAHERGIDEVQCSGAVADVGGTLVCDPADLETKVKEVQFTEREDPDLYKLDHHFRANPPSNSVPVVLYAEVGTTRFKQFHRVLRDLAQQELVDYVLRHYVSPSKRARAGKLYLSGYGVELQIKSTEYKVQDDSQVKDTDDPTATSGSPEEEVDEVEGFNFGRLKFLYPDKTANLAKLRQHLLDSTSELAPLKAWQLQELSLQAAERIMSSPTEEALKTFNLIAHNFPLQARSLVRIVVSPELRKEVKKNQESFMNSLSLQPTDSVLFLNGLFFDVDTLDAAALLEAARSELRTMEGLHSIGVKQHQLGTLLALDFLSSSGSKSTAASVSSSEYALDIRDSAVLWANDIETDKQYRRWSESLMELLRPTFPGMLRSVRKNIYNLVLVVDPSSVEARPLLRLAESFLVHQAPLHIGLVFAVNSDPEVSGREDAGVALLEAYNFAAEMGNPQQGLSLITDVYASITDEDGEIPVEQVEAAFISKFPKADPDLVFGADSQYDTGRKLAKDFIERSGFRKLPKVLLNGIPLPSDSLNADSFEEAVLTEIMTQTPSIQRAVYKGELSDRDDVIDYLMSQPNVMPRLNDRILDSKSHFIDLSGHQIEGEAPRLQVGQEEGGWPMNLSTIPERDQTAQVVYRARYVTSRKEGEATYPLTLWITCDLDTPEGRRLLNEALDNLQSTSTIRLTYLANPSNSQQIGPITRLAVAALEVLPMVKARNFLVGLSTEDTALKLTSGQSDLVLPGLTEADMKEVALMAASKAVWTAVSAQGFYSRGVLLLAPGERVVVANGRLLGPLDDGETLTSDDFALLDKFSMAAHTDRLQQAIKKADEVADDADPVPRGRQSSDLLLKLVALLVSRPQTRNRFQVPYISDLFSVVKLEPKRKDQATFEVSVIVDPVSRGAQKIGPILSVLHETINCRIRVYLNAAEKHSDMPLKSFYRYVLEAEPQFTADGKLVAGPIARFVNMPQSVLLTQNMHPPENWLVEAVRSPYDLDNIRLEDVMSSVHSEFELSSLLLEGHCSETATGTPPRGLQVTLGTRHDPVVVDTIVMANLGYFQLKANPGAWLLRLRQGRSADIFDIVSVDGSDNPEKSKDQHVLISSLRSHVLKLRVTKKPDQISADLLAEEEPPTLWNSITSSFGQRGTGTEEGQEEERLNIFSLASGHLYERFLRIMMLSVLKKTHTPVKFWFLKNYLSPTFKDFLPHMAKEYGFEYALVEYKWPRWLHQQTEKQRIIWGYKILFLDVLFPLDVKKIIFVDADQVVRTDLTELRDLDLGGAPYGYTPFCESRKEMDGFRFWKTGYWRNHLQGRKYHISALYVVDLRKFRRIAAGDRLRGQYQALSQDPNSLSNLDQDLPNNMIHQVAIKSLPQEWLWCETWCDDESKGKAKTIDLCNNPLTKEAKLTAAMRILPEWRDLDEEIKMVQERINSEHHHKQEMPLEEGIYYKSGGDSAEEYRHTEL